MQYISMRMRLLSFNEPEKNTPKRASDKKNKNMEQEEIMKHIFNVPTCNRIECSNNNPHYPNNCSICTSVEACSIAVIRYPTHMQKILMWVNKHWIRVALTFAILSLIIFWSLFIFNAGSESAIMNLRSRQESEIKDMESKIKPAAWKHLYKKHGFQTVIFEPGKYPYYINARGERCRFI